MRLLLTALAAGAFLAGCTTSTPTVHDPSAAGAPPSISRAAPEPIRPLMVRGNDFVAADGTPVRFWGVNLIATYPQDQAHAAGIAATLAERGINLVRVHHLLRPSTDWVEGLASGSLALYHDDSRTLDPVALERFDLLNAELRMRGIYLMFSANWTRTFLPGDAAIMPGADAGEWQAAIAELRTWPWQKSFDPLKMLPVFDERAARAYEESVRTILTHVNPHTGIAYGKDPQLLSYECSNEFSSEYAIICGNRFPPYFARQLQQRWETHAAAAGVAAGDLWQPANQQVALERSRFLNALDAAWMKRLTATIRAVGCTVPVEFSNLWRGDAHQALEAQHAGFSENHSYADPFVAATVDDQFRDLGRCALVDKPFIVGELNQSEGDRGKAEAPYRAMLPLAAAAYGSLHGWSGITWFAWNHGTIQTPYTGAGAAAAESRVPALGCMVADGVLLDHLRTTSLLFRRGLIAPSRQPITVTVPEPLGRSDYNGLMAGSLVVKPGWQAIHGVRYAYGASSPIRDQAPWLQRDASGPLVSDTGEICKDPARRQLTLAAPAAEAFSGMFDGMAPARLTMLGVSGDGFATVIVVADDGLPLHGSGSLVLSRTATRDGDEVLAPTVQLRGLAAGHWWLHITRPCAVCPEQHPLTRDTDGVITLPAGTWHEAEMRLIP